MRLNKPSESGSAIIYILIGVILFAALIFAFSRSNNGSTSIGTKGNTKIQAQAILDYARLVQQTTDKLLNKGCSENELNFANTLDSEHVNASAPVTKKCDIFDSAGGNIRPMKADPSWGDVTDGIIYYTSAEAIQDIGTTCTDISCADLTLNIWNISLDLCNALNTLIGNKFSSLPTDEFWGTPFTGTFGDGGEANVVFNTAALKGKTAACYKDNNYNYVFNYVLLAR